MARDATDFGRARELSARTFYEGSVGVFGEHEVELPSGVRATLPLLRHPGASAVVPFVDADHVVMLRQFRFAASGTLWEIPAGKLSPGEDPAVCALRELAEETGYRAGRLEPTGYILTAPGFTDERIHLFCAYDLTAGEAAPEPNELLEVHVLRLSEVLEMIRDGEIVDAKTIAALHHAARGSVETR